MRILVSGASGLVGSALIRLLAPPAEETGTGEGAAGSPLSFRERARVRGIADIVDDSALFHSVEVFRLVRREPKPDAGEIRWDPAAGTIASDEIEGLDAVVHLAGESIAASRWTPEKKARIRSSRVAGTQLLARTLARLARPPKVLVSVSAVGFYGDRGDEELDEASSPGSGFLAGVCRDWEAATEPAAQAGIRVVLARLGVVLAREGGALARLIPLFRLGLGGRLGSGRQYMSWITLDDAVGAIRFLLENESLCGPVNVVSPHPITNREFTRTLGRVLHRPTLFPAPSFALRIALGEMADEMLLSGARVLSKKLSDAGYKFRDPELEGAFRRVL
jgi:hypothetical protein